MQRLNDELVSLKMLEIRDRPQLCANRISPSQSGGAEASGPTEAQIIVRPRASAKQALRSRP